MAIWCVIIFHLFTFTIADDVDYEEKVGEEAALIRDLGNLLHNKSKELPKTQDIIDKIHEKDLEYEKQLKQQEDSEDLEYQKGRLTNILCNGQNYIRDYSYPCPENWQLLESGECWGVLYKGPCQALNYLTDYTTDDKKDFEIKCCVSWPKLHKNTLSHNVNRRVVRGPVNHLGNVLTAQRI